MKKNISKMIASLAMASMMLSTAWGCSAKNDTVEESEAVVTATPIPADETVINADDIGIEVTKEPESTPVAETETVPEPVAETERQDGERFEDVIIIEGMEETVKYEHIKNDMLGISIDYDYESFVRQKDDKGEKFISIYDNTDKPENYLEIIHSGQDAESAAETVGTELSKEYDIIRSDYTLDNAGECIRIDASADVGGKTMPEHLQMVYIVPAADGCVIATAHYSIEGAEGFGRRFAYIMNTLKIQ